MEKVTYAAPRYMDWLAQIRVGSATVRVHFTGGALTVYGVTPAEYTTTNPVIQKAIEMSSYFKEGRITLVKRVPMPSSTKPVKVNALPKESVPTPIVSTSEDVDTSVDSNSEVPDKTEEVSIEADHSEPVESVEDTVFKQVEVSCIQDAQDYLQQNYNIPSYKVRSHIAAQKAAAEHGIMFVGGKFAPLDKMVMEADGEISEIE